ncbi:MAG: phycobilisome protein [Planktothrix sp.]
MFTNLERLSVEVDGRYATPEELDFLKSYFQSFKYRISAYQKIQKNESLIINQIQENLEKMNQNIFMQGSVNLKLKWRSDTIRVLRYSAMALLIDDPEYLRQRLLIWFSTILQAFQVQDLTQLTCKTMSDVIKNYLTPEENNLFLPLIELNSNTLCKKRT